MPGARRRIATALAGLALLVAGAAPALAALPDYPGHTPVAKPGTALAATRALNESQLRAKLNAAVSQAGGASGVWVRDLGASSGDGVLFTDDASATLIPASNQKLFTTAAFLDRLGPEANLQTRAYAQGKVSASWGPRRGTW